MDDSFINRLGNEARELSGMFRTVTAEQVQSFVTEGIPAIEAVLGRAKGGNTNNTNNTTTTSQAATVSSATNTVAETKVEQRAEAVAETPTTSASQAATNNVLKTEPTLNTETPAAPTEAPQSEEDFLKSIGAI